MKEVKLLAVLVLTCVAAWPAGAAQTVHCTVVGAIQGAIQGDSDVVSMGRENTIQVYDFHHLVTAPSTGATQHENIIISKKMDKATVKLWTAIDTRETMSWDCRFYRPSPSGAGTEEQFYTVTLANARIVSMEPIVANTLDATTSSYPPMERVRLSYQTMTVTWNNGGVTHTLTPGAPQ